MEMAALTIVKLDPDSAADVDAALAAASSGGDTFSNDGRTYLYTVNGGVGSITVTIDSPRACSYGFSHNVSFSVPAGGRRQAGPFNPSRFGAVVSVAYSGVTDVTVAAVSAGGTGL